MVGIVIVSHCNKMCENLINFLDVFKTSDFELVNGSDENVKFGTTKDYVVKAIKKANKGEGVLILLDLGSSIDCAMQAKKEVEKEIRVEIADAPLVEGAISAVAGNDESIDLETLRKIAEESRNFRKVKND